MTTGIYKIEHVQSGKKYIGSAVDTLRRFRAHKHRLNTGIHPNTRLKAAWNKYGQEAFKFETLLICSKENLLMYEQRCIDGFDSVKSGYNLKPTAGSSLGYKQSESTRAKRSRALLGNQNGAGSKHNLGRKHSPESKEKMRAAKLGRKLSENTRAKMSAAHTGNKYALGKRASAETRLLLSSLRKGRKLTEEHKAKIGAGHRKRRENKRSSLDETIQAMVVQ